MSGIIQNAKDAIGGQGGNLQATSSALGDTLAENTKGSKQQKMDESSSELKKFGGKAGNTTEGTSVKASDQVTNMETGSADHLGMGKDLTK